MIVPITKPFGGILHSIQVGMNVLSVVTPYESTALGGSSNG